MNGFTLIILRWYHDGVLDLSSGEPIYNGGKIIEFLDVDVDKMSYFELRDYIRKLRYITSCTFSIKPPNNDNLVDIDNDMDILSMKCSLEDGDEVEVFVNHLVDEPIVDPMLLENVNHGDMEESGASFNTRLNFRVGEDHLNMEDLFYSFQTTSPFNITPLFTTADSAAASRAAVVNDIDFGPTGSNFLEEAVEGFDYSTEDIVES
ncbi:hypothetical protein FXO38_27695 [Capsicum annuum]|uniref:PB1-like domain-containing protein n=1 Tax=Capsicum annuum TaxID=4072 RepID=A0A2G2ZMW4_CAPAN|nr:hypothetical protein FXO38_27695 [Capsicum annuum]PHT83329.1 hypothetical protein T459_11772 [Capsicum annuum]